MSEEEFEVAIDRAISGVAYAVAYIDGFPDEDAMTQEMAMERIFTYFDVAFQSSQDEFIRHWLELARIELLRAKTALSHTQNQDYVQFLRKAREFLEYAAAKRVVAVDFIATSSGLVQKTSEVQDDKNARGK